MNKLAVIDKKEIDAELMAEHPRNNDWDKYIIPILRMNRLKNRRATRKGFIPDYPTGRLLYV